MTAFPKLGVVALIGVLSSVVPAQADVVGQSQLGFVSRNALIVAGPPAAVWKQLVSPSSWWSSDHTFSGDAANLTLDPVAGGCFCEKLPADQASSATSAKSSQGVNLAARGGVEHMRVVYVDRAKALRMVGSLGPLQSEAVTATLTITLKAVEGGTRVIFEYVVGGYMRYPGEKIAASVDVVMGNQLVSLARLFGPVAALGEAASVALPKVQRSSPAAEMGSKGLDEKGLLLPRGRVWSLPSNESGTPAPVPVPVPEFAGAAPAVASPPVPVDPLTAVPATRAPDAPAKSKATSTAPVIAPLPNVPVPQDVSVQAGASTVETAPSVVPKSKPKPKKIRPQVLSKTVNKADADTREPARDAIDAAFDAAFSGAPRPVPAQPPQ